MRTVFDIYEDVRDIAGTFRDRGLDTIADQLNDALIGTTCSEVLANLADALERILKEEEVACAVQARLRMESLFKEVLKLL